MMGVLILLEPAAEEEDFVGAVYGARYDEDDGRFLRGWGVANEKDEDDLVAFGAQFIL